MIGNIDLNNKTYEQILEESIAQIPIYSRDWTNYNISDPGITILDNLSAFIALMESDINEVPEAVRLKLLELAGFKRKVGKCAFAYILPDKASLEAYKDTTLPRGIKLYAQDICFEFDTQLNNNSKKTIKDLKINKITALGLSKADGIRLLEYEGIKGGITLSDFSLYLNDIPDVDENCAIYFEMETPFKRNDFVEEAAENPFAAIKWEIKTAKGFEELCVEDGTNCFLNSGYIKFSLKEDIYTSVKELGEYIIRATFERTDYDVVPRFKKICGVLTRLIQRDTKSIVEIMDIEAGEAYIEHYLLSRGYPEVYAEDENGRFVRYFDNSQRGENRYCNIDNIGEAGVRVTFGNDKPNRVMVVIRDEAVMAYRKLGRLLGYDNQEFELPPIERVFANKTSKGFSLLIVENATPEEDLSGDEVCHLVYPNSDIEGEVIYSVDEASNKVIIHDCGRYEGAWVRLGDYGVYMGDAADMLPNTELNIPNSDIKFINYARGERGHFSEGYEEIRHRFARDIKVPVTMVTEEDCKKVVGSTPGLLISKIGVSADTAKNILYIVVKPNSTEKFPKLSKTYIDIIRQHLDQYRMLTTSVEIRQPQYVAINVSGTIFAKKFLKNSKKVIESTLYELLDSDKDEIGFGHRLVFHEIYDQLEKLECVNEIANLSIYPDNYRYASMTGLDIKLDSSALFYPGQINVEVIDI